MEDNINSKSILKDNFPLHYLAKIGNFDELQNLLTSDPIEARRQLDRFDFKGRTVLHHAVLAVNLSDGEICVKIILQFLNKWTSVDGTELTLTRRRHTQRARRQQWRGDVTPYTINFINHKDVDGNTAISLAAKTENPKVVEILLLNSADVLSRNRNNERTLELIYTYAPSAIKALLDKSIAFEHGVDRDTFVRTERSYYMDFTSVIGYPDNEGSNKANPETFCLQLVNNKETSSRKVILAHPLVRYFLEMKMQKIRWISFFSLFVQICWIALYIWHAVDIYYTCCELGDLYPALQTADVNITPANIQIYCSDFPFDKQSIKHSAVTSNVINWTEALRTIVYENVTSCFTERDTLARLIPLLILSGIILIAVMFQVIALRLAFIKLKNLILWLFLLGLFITAVPTKNAFKFQFQVAAFTIVIGIVVMLELVNKHIYWAIYIRVLMKLIKRFLAIVPLFFVIILTFSTSLRMIFPSITPPMKEFRNALMEVFASIANNKVEWNEGHQYHDAMETHLRASGLIMFLVFYVTLILLLFRILIGFVVADTKKIQEEEELNEISNDLEEIYLIESLLHSKFIRLSVALRKFGTNFILFPKGDLELWLTESIIPKDLIPKMRALASKNPVKIRDILTEKRTSKTKSKRKATLILNANGKEPEETSF